MLILFPSVWLVVLPGNFIIDSIVLFIAMSVLRLQDRKQFYKKHILWIFGFGMLSDLIGAGYLLLMMTAFELGHMGDELYLTVPAIVISAALIFVFNYFISFRKDERPVRLRMSLIFAIATAPYTFLIPTSWLY